MITSLKINDNSLDLQLNQFKEKWNEIATKQGFPKIITFSGERKAQWKRILAKYSDVDFWSTFFQVLSDPASKWLSEAEYNGIKWFNVDFFYHDPNSERIVKFVEGFYKREIAKSSNRYYNQGSTITFDERKIDYE